jgi:sec-independent protein translocase protein TatC
MSDQIPHAEMSLLDHLEELRARIIRALYAFAVGVVIGYFLAPWPLEWLSAPMERAHAAALAQQQARVIDLDVGEDGALRLREPGAIARLDRKTVLRFHVDGMEPVEYRPQQTPSLFYISPMDPFMIRLKAAIIIGIVLALPVILYQTWAFVAPGLLASERRFALPVITAGSILFPLGAAFAFFLLEVTLRFFSTFVMGNAAMMNDARAYLGFALSMMLAFGVVFELPVAIVIATRMGLVTVDWLAERRRYIFVFLMVLSAVATPSGDPFTMMAMALPLYLLFEIALQISRMLDQGRLNDSESLDSDDPTPAADR